MPKLPALTPREVIKVLEKKMDLNWIGLRVATTFTTI